LEATEVTLRKIDNIYKFTLPPIQRHCKEENSGRPRRKQEAVRPATEARVEVHT
jgi:hypothetical protein